MKKLILIFCLILLGTFAIKDDYQEQTSLADPNNPLRLACPDYLSVRQNLNLSPDINKINPARNNVLNNEDQNLYSSAIEGIINEEYNISYDEDLKTYQSPNRANNLRFYYQDNGFTAKPRLSKIPLFDINDESFRDEDKKYKNIEDWSVRLVLMSEAFESGKEELNVSGNKAYIENTNLRIDYTNTKTGMRQDFIIKNKLNSYDENKTELLLKADTDLKLKVRKNEVIFRSVNGEDKMKYGSLKVWDAAGKTLDAYFDKRDKEQFAIVVNDKNAIYPLTVDPMSTVPDWKAESNQVWAQMGYFVSNAGDVNGDGFDDVIFGSHNYDNGQTNGGRVFVYYGSATGLPSTASWTADCDQSGARFGWSVSTAGDVNGDGFDDVIIGSTYYSNGQSNEGKAFVYHGSATGLSLTPDWTAEGNQVFPYFGESVSTAGDVNGDGFDDVIVGSKFYDNGQTNEGKVFLYYGSPAGLSVNADWTAEGNRDHAQFGNTVKNAGDVNDDGYDDVIIMAGYIMPDLVTDEPRVFGYFGSPTGLSSVPDWMVHNEQAGDKFGWRLASAGDVNGDGYSDVIIGAHSYSNGQIYEGKAYAYYGSNSGLPLTPNWVKEGDNVLARFGHSVSSAGDVNGDGFDDVIIGASGYTNDQTSEGRAYIFLGSITGLSNTAYWIAESNQSYSWFGQSVSTAGDVNGDGSSDVMVGAADYTDGEYREGGVFVYYGSIHSTGLTISGPSNVLINSQPVAYIISNNIGYWILSNYDQTQASIVSGDASDTVYVDPGGVIGHFVLYYQDSSTLFCAKHVYVDAPLPAELSAFTSSVNSGDIILNWTTSNEINNSGFDIERKTISSDWIKSGFVKGSGTSNNPVNYSFTDRDLPSGKYNYRLKQIDFNGNFTYFELPEVVTIGIPDKYELSQNYPNPFNPATTIGYALPKDGIVTIKIYDIRGQEVKTLLNEMKTAGYYKLEFNASDISSGAYFYRMTSGDFNLVKRFILLK